MTTLISTEVDYTKYQAGYDEQNRRIPTAEYDVTSLIPPIRKHTFAPNINPSSLIHEEAVFQALTGID